MSKVHEDNAGYVGVSYEETQDPYFSYNKLSLPLSESQLSAKQPAEETFTVTVANSKFVIGGVSQASLSLAEGGIYKFDQSDSSNVGHPLRFSYTEDGTHGDGQEYTLGVTTNGTPGSAGAYTKIVVPFGLHDLYYYCSVHSGYGGFANVAKDVYKFTTGLPILKTTDAFGKTLGTGNNEDPFAANLALAIPMAEGRVYTTEGTTSGSFYDSAGGAASKMFDGDASTGAFSQSGTATFTFGGTTITATSSVQIRAFKGDAAGANVLVNGTDVSSSLNSQSGGGYSTVDITTTLGGAPITLSSVSVVNAGGGSGNIAQIFVDGVELIDEVVERDVSAAIRGSGSAKAITVFSGSSSGGAVASTAVSKYYGSSFYVVRGGVNANESDYITRTGDSDLSLGTGDFCVEFWFYSTSLVSNFVMFDNRHPTTGWPSSSNGFAIIGNASGNIFLYHGGNVRINHSAKLTANAWHHIAVTRESGVERLFVNGDSFSATYSSSNDYNEGRFVLGSSAPNGEGTNGYFQDLRIYKGVAKYTTPFTTGSYGMDVLTYNGNGSTQTISGLNFQPDFVWIKGRDFAGDHALFDAVRGATKRLRSNQTNAENTDANTLTAFNSDGFSLGSSSAVNNNTKAFVGWAWKAGGAAVSNTDGTITSSVSANTDYGFSIVGHTGNGTAGATIGHGLNGPIGFMVIKNRDSAYQWLAWHKSFNGNNYIPLNTTDAVQTNSAIWNGTSPSSSVITLGTNVSVNENTSDHIGYCWSEVSGFSKFGSYTGAANLKITTGFKPRFVLIKCSSEAGFNWVIVDSARGNSSNGVSKKLYPNSSTDEDNDGRGTETKINFLDDGFQFADQGAETNSGTRTYIYAAFAESVPGDAEFESLVVDQLDLNDRSGNSNNASNAGATWQTSVSKFYGGAADFSSNGKATVSGNDFAFGTGDYTIEMWVYHTALGAQATYFGDTYGSTSGVYFYKNAANYIGVYYSSQVVTGGTLMPQNAWVHVAAVRNAGTTTVYVNGSPDGSASDSTNLTVTDYGVGETPGGNSGSMEGYIQDVRVYKGIAKYTSSFTPPERSVQGTARRYPSGIYVVS